LSEPPVPSRLAVDGCLNDDCLLLEHGTIADPTDWQPSDIGAG